MDNVTHALAGMLLAEAACHWSGEARPRVRAAAYLVSALANNLPDIDVTYAWAMGAQPLGNLLHHRGHTHTLLLALPAGWLLGAVTWRWLQRREPALQSREKRLIYGLSVVGVLVHLILDFGNNYGVHPFWPLSPGWFYGDSIFIVEPAWWAVAIPLVASWVSRRWLKWVLWSLLLGIFLVCWYVPFVLPVSRAALLALCVASFSVARWASPRGRLAYAFGAWLVIAGVFVAGSSLAKGALQRATTAAFPALDVQDWVLTPMPLNPACWEGLAAGEQGGLYRVVRAKVALPPLRAEHCQAGEDVEPTAPVERLSRPIRDGVQFQSEYHASLAELRELAARDCEFAALLRFARLPYVTPPSGAARFAGDLRYDRSPTREFADVALTVPPASHGCPRFVPGWRPPRARLLEP